jgi:hypothetical protein
MLLIPLFSFQVFVGRLFCVFLVNLKKCVILNEMGENNIQKEARLMIVRF